MQNETQLQKQTLFASIMKVQTKTFKEVSHTIVSKVNVDEEPELAAAFGVASIPMFAVLKDGKVVNTKVGAMPKASLETMLE